MPSRKRRNITVDGTLYHYMMNPTDGITIIQNTETQELKKVVINEHEWFVLRPGHVKAMILAGDDKNWQNYLENHKCNCGNEGTKVRRMCAFDIEIRYKGTPPKYCYCCDECRDRCAEDV